MGQHTAARKRRHWARWTLLTLGTLLCLAYWHGHSLRTQALSECLPGVTPYATGSMHFNPCATLDTTQIKDLR